MYVFTVYQLNVAIHAHTLPIYHKDLLHSVSTAVFEHAPGRRHMDSKLACRGIWFLLESNPVFPQGTSTLLHLRVKKKQKYWVLAITYFKSLEFESSSRNLNDYLSLQCGHASEYYVGERMITIALVLFSIQSIFLEVKFTVQGVSRRDRTKVCYDAFSSRLIIGFVGCWLQDISHRREGRGHKHLRMVLVDYTPQEEEEEEEALSATLSEWIEKQRIIQ